MKLKTGLVISFLCFLWNFSPLYANVKIGTVYFYPPYIMSAQEGFDIDLLKRVCKGINEKCDLIPMDFNQLFPMLKEGKIDLAISGLTVSQKEHTFYIYSTPYMISKAQFLVLKNSGAQSTNDLKGKSVGVLRGNEEYRVFYDYLNNSDAQFKIVQYNNTVDIINALARGSISAAFIHSSAAIYWEKNGEGKFKRLGPDFLLGDGISILALPKNAHLIQKINQQLSQFVKDGTFLRLYKRYFSNF